LEEEATSVKTKTAQPLLRSRSLGSSLTEQQVLVIRTSVLSGLLRRQHPPAPAGIQLEPCGRWVGITGSSLAVSGQI